jgi:hypothetical protein
MASRDGRKTPTGSEIDDWFDLLDDESPALPPKAPGPSSEVKRKVTPSVDPRAAADSWDWDMETPVVSSPPPVEVDADEEFTDFGGPLPIARAIVAPPPPPPIARPIGASSTTTNPQVEGARRYQGTMMFGVNSLVPPPSAEAPPTLTPPSQPPPATAATVSARPEPFVSAHPSMQTPVPRPPVPRAAPYSGRPIPRAAPVTSPPPSARSHQQLPSSDLDDLEFEDVAAKRRSTAPRVEGRSEKATQQRATPVVPVAEPMRGQQTPVVQHSIPPEAQRSSLPPRRGSAPQRSLMPPSTRREMVDRFELGDFTGALSLADTLLEIDRTDAEARRIAETSRNKLRAIYIGRLGTLDQVPVMMIPHAELRWLALDHRAGFVLSLVDGTSSIEEIIDVSTMAQLEVLRTLYNLLSQNVISLRRPRH